MENIFDTVINNITAALVFPESFVSKKKNKLKLGQRQISKQIKPPRPKSPTAERNCDMIYGKSKDKDIIDFRAKQFPKASTHSSLKHNEHEKFTIGLTMFM